MPKLKGKKIWMLLLYQMRMRKLTEVSTRHNPKTKLRMWVFWIKARLMLTIPTTKL
jgi:hypothetical protein